ncbi:uncharacterized protein LOC122651611 isoform X1 [Telopea speciosissima]|uniref:uncharacterized protein LOC122651611 isoform X1 n=1 Tax=Telopea speciosissima TaxID=54955 RepID=UPI001CC3729E|nr:uncharacterized protein LOC122651611 isoform X1 [Telopea speciosissima]
MEIRFWTNLKVRVLLLASLILCFFPGVFSSGVVTLKSIQIFNTHEWFNAKPTVYFHCKGENKTILPDVKKADVVYTFKGEESFQPLTELPDEKCKRCGLYEMDFLTSDDIFDEWEFCSSDFIDPDGNYVRFKSKEFNATFLCPQCVHLKNDSDNASDSHNGANAGKKMNVLLVILIIAIVSTVSILGMVAAYRYWQRRKRDQDHARFLKLFEEGDEIFFDDKDGDDIEDEFGLKQEL